LGAEVEHHAFLTLALEESEWSTSCPSHFTPEEKPQYPFDRRLERSQSQCGHGGEEKNSQPLPGMKPPNPNCPACKTVAILTELPWIF